MIPLRVTALVLFLILVNGTTLNLHLPHDTTQPILLLDRSSSMARFLNQTEETLETVAFPHTVYAFSESLLPQQTLHDTSLGRYTDITSALLRVDRDRPPAILLVSDGNHNFGPSPLSVAGELMTPIYCFGVGDDAQTDIAIVDIAYPQYAYAGDSIKIDVIVTSRGYQSGTGRISITNGGIIRHRDFPLSTTMAKHTVSFWFTVQEPEIHTFTAEIIPQKNEITYENNRAVFSVHALLDKIQVLYFTEHVSFNTKFILRTLQHDTHIDLQAFASDRDGRLTTILASRFQSIPSPANVDVLVMDNVHMKNMPWDTLDRLVANGLGVVCMGELRGQGTGIEQILPISTLSPGMTGSFPITVIQPFSCLMPGDNLAPFTSINRIIAARETAVIIAATNNLPLIAYHRYGSGFVFQIGAIDIGKWQFLQTGFMKKDVLSRLLTDAVRFVSPQGANTRLVLSTLTGEYLFGETIEASLESYDRDFRKTGGGDFFLTYQQTRIPFYETSSGTYRATFTADTVGTLRLKAAGTLRDEPLTSNELSLTVRHRPIEYEEGLNHELLGMLAEATGGTFQPLSDISRFRPPEGIRRSSTRIHLDTPVTYLLIVLLLAADWILRKRRGII